MNMYLLVDNIKTYLLLPNELDFFIRVPINVHCTVYTSDRDFMPSLKIEKQSCLRDNRKWQTVLLIAYSHVYFMNLTLKKAIHGYTTHIFGVPVTFIRDSLHFNV